MVEKGDSLTCGCVIGYYYCSEHDIYTTQDRINDPRWTNPDSMKVK